MNALFSQRRVRGFVVRDRRVQPVLAAVAAPSTTTQTTDFTRHLDSKYASLRPTHWVNLSLQDKAALLKARLR
jgi:hypothetical protein